MNTILTDEEMLDIIEASFKAEDEGRIEDASKLIKRLPMAPYLAEAAKEMFGPNYLRERGFNLVLANEEFGHDWLDR